MAPRRSIGLFSLILVGYIILTVRTASARSLNYDEVYTFKLAQFHSLRQLWEWLHSGTDLNPPLNYIFARMTIEIVGPTPLGVRLYSVIAYGIATLLMFFYLRRRHRSELAGWLAGLTMLACSLPYYAVISRAYALMVMWGAAALLFRHAAHTAETSLARILAGVALGFVVSASLYTHYYGALLLLPIALGELVEWWKNGRINRIVAIPFCIAAATGVGLLPLVQSHRGFSDGFWARASWAAIEQCYDNLLINFATPLFLVAAVCFCLKQVGLSSIPRDPGDDATVIGFLLVPAVGVALGVVITGVFDKRYVVIGYCGAVALFAGLLVPRVSQSKVGSAFVLLVLIGWWLLGTELRYRKYRIEEKQAREVVEVTREFLESKQRVYAIDAHVFLTTAVSMSDTGRHLLFPADPVLAKRYRWTDTDDRNLLQLVNVDHNLSIRPFSNIIPSIGDIVIGDSWQKKAWEDSGYQFVQIRTVGAKIPVYRVSALPPKTRP